jgi:AraC-like DNA-binding protein
MTIYQATFESAFPLRMDAGWMSPAHTHDLYEIFYVCSGLMETVNNGESSFCSVSQFQIQPPGQEHIRGNCGEDNCDTLVLRWEGDDPQLPQAPRVVEDHRGHLPNLLKLMVDLHPAETAFKARNLDILTQAALCEIAILLKEGTGKLVSQIRPYVLNHLAEDLTLDRLATAVGYSRYHFARQFKQETGKPPMAYVRELRASAAVQILRHTTLKLHAVARNVGFVDASHLTRAVREFYQLSPGQLRRNTSGE